MAMMVQHNMQSINANRMLGITTAAQAKSTEKLSSGYKINRAGDDAAGLAISEKMRGQIRGLNKASDNAQNGISLIQTAEGALTETHSIIQRMRELAVQSSTDTNTDDDRTQIQNEIDQLTQEVDRIANTTEFNTKKLLNGAQKGAVTGKAGSVTIEGTFANGAVKILDLTTSGKLSALGAITGTTVIRYEVMKDATGADAITVSTTDLFGETGVTGISGGTLKFSSGSYSLEVSTGTVLTSGGSEVEIAITNADKLKAGDVITITVNAATLTEQAKTGKEALRLQVGANAGQEIMLGINSMLAKDLGITQISGDTVGKALNVSDQKNASLAVNAYDMAIQKVSTERAKMGAVQNRLEHTVSNLDSASENTQSAESRIRDTDMASEMVNYSKNNILAQAGQSMLAQANQSTQGVLSLLG